MSSAQTSRSQSPATDSITGLLADWRHGRTAPRDRLMARIYPQLRAMAALRLPADGRTWTLQPTEVVHETYLKLIAQHAVRWRNQGHFFNIASRLMRRVIADHARRRGRQKRGGGQRCLPLSQIPGQPAAPAEHGRLDELLLDLARIDARAAQVVELRCHGGMTSAEAAEVLGVSARTVARDWRFGRAWLRHQLAPATSRAASDPSSPRSCCDPQQTGITLIEPPASAGGPAMKGKHP